MLPKDEQRLLLRYFALRCDGPETPPTPKQQRRADEAAQQREATRASTSGSAASAALELALLVFPTQGALPASGRRGSGAPYR